LAATIIDKILIVWIAGCLIFVAALINIEYIGHLGVFSALFHMSPESLHNMAVGHVMHSFPNDRMNEHQSEIDNYYRYLLGLELTVVILFTFINIVYYHSFERIKKASLGKNSLGLKIIDSSSGIYLTSKQALYRVGIFLIMMFSMIAIRWLVGLNYYVIILLFFLFMDIPIFIVGKSFLDLVTNTECIYEPPLNDGALQKGNITQASGITEIQCKPVLKHLRNNSLRKISKWAIITVMLLTIISLFFCVYSLYSENKDRFNLEKKILSYHHEEEADIYIKNTSWNQHFQNNTPYLLFEDYVASCIKPTNTNTIFGEGIATVDKRRWVTREVKKPIYENTWDYDRFGRPTQSVELKGYKTVQEQHPYDYKYQYTYHVMLKAFNVLNEKTLFENQEKFAARIMEVLHQFIVKNYSGLNDIRNENGTIEFLQPQGENNIHCTIFFANNKIYLFETAAEEVNWELHHDILNSFETTQMDILIKHTKMKILLSGLFFLICCFVLYVIAYRNNLRNSLKTQKYMLRYISICTTINIVLVLFFLWKGYTDEWYLLWNGWTQLFISCGTLILINFPTMFYLSNRSKIEYRYDYWLPLWLKAYLTNRSQSITEYKSVVSLVAYPIFFLANLPWGCIILVVTFPLIAVQIILFEFRRWYVWLSTDENNQNRDKKICKIINLPFLAILLYLVLLYLAFKNDWITYF